ncbi:MAG TPA: penicillin acylase family protein [Anaerolineales bacterium]|nr:penicillin acylase family protein [Anaerolineales bacterium]
MAASKIGRGLVILLSVVLILTLIGSVLGVITVRRSFPVVDGNLQVPGLIAAVDIYRDTSGIPQIYAANQHDLFFAQGFVHAQDRFWQMDFWRHLSAGRLAEMFGQDQVETDSFLRTLGWRRVAQQELEAVDADTRSILEAYAAGVNAYLVDHQGSAVSLEYAILALLNPDYAPKPWQALDTVTWAKVMAWDLGANMDDEIEKAILSKSFTAEQLAQIYPNYPEDGPVIVKDFPGTSGAVDEDQTRAGVAGAIQPALDEIASRLANIPPVLGERGIGLGSNSWAVSGPRSATGMPILANDPHLGVQMPPIWYQIGLHCLPVSSECPIEVAGFSFAGVPGVVIGHTARIAWGFTNTGPDVQDLFVEKINPENPEQYEVNGVWQDMVLVNESIRVAGGEEVPLTVRYTRNGPIISETYALLEEFSNRSGIDLPQTYAISLRWTALEAGNTISAIMQFSKAQNWDEFRAASRQFVAPSQNLLYADVDGNIGYQMPGNIPIRVHGDGTLPVPGWTDEYQWQGYIPFEELPYVFNPPEGYIVTANNAVVGEEYPYSITTAWDYGYRASRIIELIENASGPLSLEDMQQFQADNKDLNAELLVPILLSIPMDDSRLAAGQALLEGWDFQDQMESASAGLFAAFWKHLLARTFVDELPEDYQPEGSSRWFAVMHRLVAQPDSTWWDDQSTQTIERRDDIFRLALEGAIDELEGILGKDPQDWKWGRLHTVLFENASLGESGIAPIEALFNRGPFETSGGSSIVNATGWKANKGYEVTSLPSMRMLIDLGNLDNSLTIMTTGESGHAYHPNYIDMADDWRMIQYRAMLWSRAQVEDNAPNQLHLQP